MLDIYLIIIGLFILIFAILNFFNLLRHGLHKSVRLSWIGMTIMTIFFSVGYFGYIYLVTISNTQGLLTLTAWIFFLGAIYVLLTVLTIISTLNQLKTERDELETKIMELQKENDGLKPKNPTTPLIAAK